MCAARKPGQEHVAQIPVFDSVVFTLEDHSAPRFMYEAATEHSTATIRPYPSRWALQAARSTRSRNQGKAQPP